MVEVCKGSTGGFFNQEKVFSDPSTILAAINFKDISPELQALCMDG
jgi:hypothetical protein